MYYSFKNISLYYEKYGTGNTSILILPGWGDNRFTFSSIIQAFQDEFSIYIFDYPGFGKSSILSTTWDMNLYAECFYSFIKVHGIYNPIIIAHSFGGRIVSLLIGKYKLRVKKLVLMDVAGIKHRKGLLLFLKERIYKFLKLLSFFLPRQKKYIYHKKLLNLFASSDYQSIPSTMRGTFQNIIQENLSCYYKKIRVETLLLWGEKDLDTPLTDGRRIHRYIPNSYLIVLPGAHHFSYLEYPVLTVRILDHFLH